VAAWGVVRAGVDDLKALRQNPGAAGEPLPAAFLKHADDQTVAGLAAVFRAINQHGLTGTDFTRWAVLAAPRFLARAALAQALKRFALEGAWGVSPHLIPHRSLHSVSGTVSQALKIHGPNFGVGGGPCGAAKAVLAAAALVADPRLPGTWLVLTGWNWEPGLEAPTEPSRNGHAEAATCSAVALALRPANSDHSGMCLNVAPDYTAGHEPAPYRNGHAAHANGVHRNGTHDNGSATLFSLEALVAALAGSSKQSAWQLGCGGWVGLEPAGIGAENRL
jgi:hypothetical protein